MKELQKLTCSNEMSIILLFSLSPIWSICFPALSSSAESRSMMSFFSCSEISNSSVLRLLFQGFRAGILTRHIHDICRWKLKLRFDSICSVGIRASFKDINPFPIMTLIKIVANWSIWRGRVTKRGRSLKGTGMARRGTRWYGGGTETVPLELDYLKNGWEFE